VRAPTAARRGQRPRALGAIVVGFVLLVLLALLVRGGPVVFDQPLAEAASALRDWPVVALLDLVVSLPLWSAVVVLVGALMWRAGRRRPSLLVLSSLTAELATAALKAYIDRPRPVGAEVTELLASASFPSGHVVRAVVALGLTFVVLARSRAPLGGPFLVLATVFLVALAIARVASGEHHASDVLGGLLLGAVWLRVILLAEDILCERRRRA
jgi:membrane-associated phospholipid phosphatase